MGVLRNDFSQKPRSTLMRGNQAGGALPKPAPLVPNHPNPQMRALAPPPPPAPNNPYARINANAPLVIRDARPLEMVLQDMSFKRRGRKNKDGVKLTL